MNTKTLESLLGRPDFRVCAVSGLAYPLLPEGASDATGLDSISHCINGERALRGEFRSKSLPSWSMRCHGLCCPGIPRRPSDRDVLTALATLFANSARFLSVKERSHDSLVNLEQRHRYIQGSAPRCPFHCGRDCNRGSRSCLGACVRRVGYALSSRLHCFSEFERGDTTSRENKHPRSLCLSKSYP